MFYKLIEKKVENMPGREKKKIKPTKTQHHMVGWVLFMCSRDTLTDIFFRKICSWPTLNTCSAENVGKSQFSCAVYNVLKATFKLLEPFYHPIISFLHLKACLTLEKYTELDSQAAVKPKDILGNCWPFPSSSGESCRDVVQAQTPQKNLEQDPGA